MIKVDKTTMKLNEFNRHVLKAMLNGIIDKKQSLEQLILAETNGVLGKEYINQYNDLEKAYELVHREYMNKDRR